MAKATALLEEAYKVLVTLKKDDFYVLQSIKKPTPTVILGMEVSCLMMGKKPKKADWNKYEGDEKGFFETARSQLFNNPGAFMKAMKEYDKEHMEEKIVKRVSAIIGSSDFSLKKVQKALVAILKWASAIITYNTVLKHVGPEKEQLKVAKGKEELAAIKKECEDALALALPVYHDALKALD